MTTSVPPASARLAAAYARTNDANHQELQAQLVRCQARAEEEGYVLPDRTDCRFFDQGAPSEGLDRLVRMVETGEAPFSALYVEDLTRFGRFEDPIHHLRTVGHFRDHGVQVRAVEGEAVPESPTWDRLHDEAPIRLENYLPDPPVSEALFERAQRILEHGRARKPLPDAQ